MPSIETLAKDIQDLVENDDHVVSDEAKEKLGRELADLIVKNLFTGRKDQENRGALRMSSLGTPCVRQLWYKEKFPNEGEKLPYNARIKYLFGHILEELLLFLAEEAGHTVEKRQQRLELEGVVGHRDAVIDGVQTDVKSASTRGFDKFKYHKLETEDPFGYLVQNNAYLQADKELTDKRVAFLAIDKQFGNICVDVYESKEYPDLRERIGYVRRGLDSEQPPVRAFMPEPDGKAGNLKLGVQCSYCERKASCYPGLRTFLYSSGPRYLTHVVREPDVPEAKKEDLIEE